MSDEQQAQATIEDLRELQKFFNGERDRFKRIEQVATALGHIAGIEGAAEEAAAKLQKTRVEIDEATARFETLRAAVGDAEAGAEVKGTIEDGRQEARRLITDAEAKADLEHELAEAEDHLNRAQTEYLLGFGLSIVARRKPWLKGRRAPERVTTRKLT